MKVIFQSVVDSPIPNMVLKPENLQDEIILNAIINRNGTPNMPDAEYSVISIERNINALQSITLGLNSGNAVNIYQLLLEQDEVASKRTSQLNEADSLDDSYSVMVIKDGRNYKTTLQSILSLLSIPEVPQNLSEYNNDAGFITSSDITSKADLIDGKIPANQLPSYVDDVLEFATFSNFPGVGESGKLYLAIDSNIIYRWTGSTYASTSSPIALGETASSAYRGDRGKTAYDHSQESGNPHGTNKSDIGLGNVDNTSDSNKPISNATQAALDTKKDKTILSASLPITYTSDKYYGTFTSPLSSSITFDLTGAIAGTKAIVFHNAGTEPIYPAGVIKKGIGIYNTSQTNVLIFQYIDSNTILLDVQPASTAGLQPELVTWLSKGGSATGFVLSAMNQFLLDIASIRSKILRFNPIMGETFSSAFIPLIVNADGSGTPLGNALDLNNNFVSSDFKLIGTSGGLLTTTGVSKYIDTGFIPSSITEFGLNDCGFGHFGKVTNQYIDILATNTNGSSQNTCMNSAGFASLNSLSIATNYYNYYNLMGFYFVTRNNSSQIDGYCSGAKATYTLNSTSKANSTIKYGIWSAGQSSASQLLVYVLTKGLNTSEEAILRTAITSLQSKLGRI